MIDLHLTRGDNYEGVYLRLPATPAEIGEAFGWLDEISTAAPTKIIGATSNIPNLHRYLCNEDIDAEGGLDKFQQIAAKINSLNSRQTDILVGALDAGSINGPEDILSVIDQLDKYAFIPNVTCDKELGGYLVENGFMDFPARVLPYLDYNSIGAEYYAEHGGAYTNRGYVLRKSALEPYLDMEQEPVFRVHLHSMQTRQYGIEPCVLELPAMPERMEQMKRSLGVEDYGEAAVVKVECMKPILEELLPLKDAEDADVYLLSDLADCIGEMEETDGALIKFCAVLEVERPLLLMDAVDIACDLDNYERITEGTYEYGQSVLRRYGVDEEFLHAMEGYMDFERLGEDAMIEDGVRQTEFGLVRRISEPFPELGYEQTMG